MGVKRSVPTAHMRRAAPDDEAAPVKKTKSVSVTSIFKQHHPKTKNSGVIPQINLIAPSSPTRDAPVRKVKLSKQLASSHSPHKSSSRVSKKRSEDHPFVTEFKEASKEYRLKIYNDAVGRIDEDLDALLEKLYEGTSETICSADKTDPKAPPSKLSATAKYDRLTQNLYFPISEYVVRCRSTNLNGEEVSAKVSIDQRFKHFDEQIHKQTDEIKKLQSQWEATVSEIFKLGVTCLGEDAMTAMLLPKQAPPIQDQQSSPSEPESESALFVREKNKGKKKQVTFEPPVNAVALPSFLYRPSNSRKRTAPEAPRLSTEKVETLQAEVSQLGNDHVDEFRQVEREYAAWWKKKTKQIASALGDD